MQKNTALVVFLIALSLFWAFSPIAPEDLTWATAMLAGPNSFLFFARFSSDAAAAWAPLRLSIPCFVVSVPLAFLALNANVPGPLRLLIALPAVGGASWVAQVTSFDLSVPTLEHRTARGSRPEGPLAPSWGLVMLAFRPRAGRRPHRVHMLALATLP